MKKLNGRHALAGVLLLSAAAAACVWLPPHAKFAAGETDEAERGRSPGDGDYWAVHYGYHGDTNNLHYE